MRSFQASSLRLGLFMLRRYNSLSRYDLHTLCYQVRLPQSAPQSANGFVDRIFAAVAQCDVDSLA